VRVDNMRNAKVPELRRNVGVVFQDFKLLADKTVWENVAFALQVTGARTKDVMRQVPRVLDQVGLAHKSARLPERTLRRRTAAHGDRAGLGQQSEDHALRRADRQPRSVNANEIMDLLHRINLKGTTIVVATHNAQVVDRMRRRVIRLEHGKIVADDERGFYHVNDAGEPVRPSSPPSLSDGLGQTPLLSE
jgi:cell division transport system ATP-binding protein